MKQSKIKKVMFLEPSRLIKTSHSEKANKLEKNKKKKKLPMFINIKR